MTHDLLVMLYPVFQYFIETKLKGIGQLVMVKSLPDLNTNIHLMSNRHSVELNGDFREI